MKLNLPNKITLARIFLAIIILIMLMVPWESFNVQWPVYVYKDILISLEYIVAGILFLIAALTDFLDGYIARSRNLVTDFGKVADAIADKILVNGLLVILAYERIIPVIIPVVIITRDIITDSCKSICGNKGSVVAASNLGKLKTIFMMVGLTLVMFYDFPFILFNFNIGEILLMIATLLSVVSGVEYVYNSMPYLFPKDK